MKIHICKDKMTTIETEIYQSKCGSICLNWGNTSLILDKEKAESIFYDIPDTDIESFRKYYYRERRRVNAKNRI